MCYRMDASEKVPPAAHSPTHVDPSGHIPRRGPKDMAVSAIAPDGHLRVVSRHGELMDKRPDDDALMTQSFNLAMTLWLFTLIGSFVSVVCIILLAHQEIPK